MIWTGSLLQVVVTPKQGMGGKFGSDGKARPVYALRSAGNDVSVLVADDDGTLMWLSSGHCKVAAAAPPGVAPQR